MIEKNIEKKNAVNGVTLAKLSVKISVFFSVKTITREKSRKQYFT